MYPFEPTPAGWPNSADSRVCGCRPRAFNVVGGLKCATLYIEVDTLVTWHPLIRVFEQMRGDDGRAQVLRTNKRAEFQRDAFVTLAMDDRKVIGWSQSYRRNKIARIERLSCMFRADVLERCVLMCLDAARELPAGGQSNTMRNVRMNGNAI